MKNRNDRDQAEERLRLLSSMVEQSTAGMATADLDGTLTYVNTAWCEMHGYSDSRNLIGKDLAICHNEDQLKNDVVPFNAMVMRHGKFSGEVGHITRDGKIFPTLMTSTRIEDDSGVPVAIARIVRDITELKRTEEALLRTRYAMDHAADAVFWILSDARIVYANHYAEKLLGYTREQLLTMTIHDIDPEFPKERWPQHWQELQHKKSMVFESTHRRANGETYPVEVALSYGEFDGKGYNFAFFRDITKRRRASRALRESEDRLSKIMIAANDGMWDWDLATDAVYFDPRYYHMAGYEVDEFPHRLEEFRNRVHPEDLEHVFQLAQQHLQGEIERFNVEFRFKMKSGEWIWILGRGVVVEWDENQTPLRFVGTHTDITDRKQAEEKHAKLQAQLAQAQKMESVGRLAGGMAHDFNNMLGVILGHAELALRQLDAAQPIHADLTEIQKAGERSAELTRQLLAFARKQTVTPRTLNLNDTLAGMLNMLRRLIGEDIDLIWVPNDDLWPVKIDPSQIDQVLVNLCVNARDAITGVGKIIIETGNEVLSENYCAEHADLTPGDYATLCVSDDGCGMESEVQQHIFDPFFTTKSATRGTGLGLSTVFGIIKQNQGHIHVYSEPGHGTIFKIYLPRFVGKRSSARGSVPPGRWRAGTRPCCWWKTSRRSWTLAGGCWSNGVTAW